MGGARRVAVVGSGISGLGSAWLLNRSGWDVTLYESEPIVGGHTLTDETEAGSPVDLGFQVFNFTNYPHLVQLFEQLGVGSEQSEMSFALSMDDGQLEWSSNAIFAQRSNMASPSFLRMISDMVSFNSAALSVLSDPQYRDVSVQQYLDQHGYSRAFAETYLLPMCAAIWSVPGEHCLTFPVQTVVAFLNNHHMLDLFNRPNWRVVTGRSRVYAEKIVAELPDVRTSTPVTRVERDPKCPERGGITVHDATGAVEKFDTLVMATHTDISLKILGEGASPEESQLLGAIPYQANEVFLHKDPALMPRRREAWASWNVLGRTAGASAGGAETESAPVCVSYWVNSLQKVEDGIDRFVTLNPLHPPKDELTIRRLTLSHPSFSFAARKAQEALPELQGKQNTWFCGAWAGWGFHEDGLKSAVAVTTALGAPPPWVARSLSPKIPMLHSMAINVFEKACRSVITKGSLRILLPNGNEMAFGQMELRSQVDDTAAPSAAFPRGTTLGETPLQAATGSKPVHVTLRIFDTAFFGRAIKDQDCGLGESYMDGEYDVDNITNWVLLLIHNMQGVEEATSSGLLGIVKSIGTGAQELYHKSRVNTLLGSRRNISEHYDLGNDMYKLFLDPTLTYSSGIFKTAQDTMEQASYNKLDALLKKSGIKKGQRLLEIGCGWGSMAIRAASTIGCSVIGVTISEEQFDEAVARVKAAKLEDKVDIVFLDYRKLPATYGVSYFDAAVSCEMIEAVGHEHLPSYFKVLNHMVRPGGKVAVQAITIQDARYEGQLKGADFIKRHIFPGSVLPSSECPASFATLLSF